MHYTEGLFFKHEEDMYNHTVFSAACESSTLSTKERDALPDSAYGLVVMDADGKKIRKYPLVGDSPAQTLELQQKAIAYFSYCAPEYKQQVAQSIVNAAKKTKSGVRIGEKNLITKFAMVPKDMIGEEMKFKK